MAGVRSGRRRRALRWAVVAMLALTVASCAGRQHGAAGDDRSISHRDAGQGGGGAMN